MRKGLVLAVIGLLGCTSSAPTEEHPVSPSQPEPEAVAEPEPGSEPEPEPEPEAANVSVQLTAATLADDCGDGPNTRPEPSAKPKPNLSAAKSDRASKSKEKRAKRRCKQSSIQLAVTAAEGAASTKLAVKSVELTLADGKSLGMLEVRSPSVWSDGDGYTAWDETVEAGQDLSVSYAVTQPDWSQVDDRRSQTYTMKAVVSVAGTDQTLEQNVVLDIPTSLPPGVRT